MNKAKEPVRLRERLTPSGRTSLYLDIYMDGKRSYEYLHLYLVPEHSSKDKEANRQTRRLAEAICAKRVVEIRNGKYGFLNKNDSVSFLEYYRNAFDEATKKATEKQCSRIAIWSCALSYLEQYCKPNTMLSDIDKHWMDGLRDYLFNKAETRFGKRLSKNTALTYMAKVCQVVNKAYADGLIQSNPLTGYRMPQWEDTERVFLTIEEVKAMAKVDIKNRALKRAFLFSCLTGLRKSDIQHLHWCDVAKQGEYTRIVFRQQKTGGQMYLDISDEAAQYMGDRKAGGELVFGAFRYNGYVTDELRAWARSVGIDKKITFHSGRHTFAVMMISLGVGIYTVKELLGHAAVTTTQVYAKVLDKTKQDAVARIPKIIDVDDNE